MSSRVGMGLCASCLTAELVGGPRILSDISLGVEAGVTTVVVGKSGAGKSTLLLAILGLLGEGWCASGAVLLNGTQLLGADSNTLRGVRGRRIAWAPQASVLALQPGLTIGSQLRFALRTALGLERVEAEKRGRAWLERVGGAGSESWWPLRPTELSGGMARLVLVALAFACEPAVLLADEPTVGLDAGGQDILKDLMREAQKDRAMGALIVTHDIGFEVGAEDRLAVMEAGKIVECGLRREVLREPQHERTKLLVAAAQIPRYVAG